MRALVLVAWLVAAPVAAQEISPSEIAEQARPAVVLVSALADGVEIGQGSGFVVSPDGRIVTNRHVIQGADELRVELATGEIYDRVYFVSADERRDLAILRVPATGLATLPIGDDRAARIGDRVYVIGNPMGLEGTFTDGLISARRMVDGVSFLQISAPISPGSSGGPVLNAAGEAIAIATLTMPEGQNLNMAVPARYATGLLAMDDEPQPFEQVASRFAEAGEETAAADLSASTGEELEPWAEVLADEIETVRTTAHEMGLVTARSTVVEMIDEDQTYSMDFT
ncbi:MAG: S1C family serine protease, partial [Longimicrobiales bacterium]